MNFLDLFAQKLREKREQKKITQRELAERLNMCTRTVIEIEKCKSNPKFETVALISEEMDISLDGIVFHDRAPQCQGRAGEVTLRQRSAGWQRAACRASPARR